MRRVLCVLILIAMCLITISGRCEITPIEAGQQDAQRDVPRPKWFIEGCVTGVLFMGIVGGNQVTKASQVPPEVVVNNVPNLLGKSPEYVEKYVSAYKTESVRLQSRWAGIGMKTGTGLTTAVIIIFLISRL